MAEKISEKFLLDKINYTSDIRQLTEKDLNTLSDQVPQEMIEFQLCKNSTQHFEH